jgi:hypothetical protein
MLRFAELMAVGRDGAANRQLQLSESHRLFLALLLLDCLERMRLVRELLELQLELLELELQLELLALELQLESLALGLQLESLALKWHPELE